MSEPRFVSLRRAVPWGFVGMLALLSLGERVVARHEIDLILPIAWEWKFSARAASREAGECEILSFGDSLIKLGLQPRIIERQIGRRTFNLAVAGGQAPASFFLFRRALEAGARPRAVMIDCEYTLLSEGLDYNRRQWPELLSLRDAVELSWTARDAGFFATMLLARAFPTFKDRHDIRASLMRALRGQNLGLREEMRSSRRNWKLNAGARLFAKNAQCKDVIVPPGTPLPPSTWQLQPLNAKYLKRFLDLAEAHDVTVFWLLTPITPGLQDVFDRKGDTERYDRFIRNVHAHWPNLVVVDARRSGYDHSVFVDPVHLDRQGSLVLSTD
ncbi:MAG TPA: hypothetical protein VGZ22_06625, partial [Isosphaeraceae bacterium]|nr:hypothetical protein [Isosphaeraceae bacterium]